jgi:purine-nucleoside phosphorylase
VLGGHFDIAVRDVVLAIAAYTLARFEQVREKAPSAAPVAQRRTVTA